MSLALTLLVLGSGALGPRPEVLETEAVEQAVVALREAGFPAMAQYRAFVITTTCDAATKVRHGWVAADGRTALGWDGVVYPISPAVPEHASVDSDLQAYAAKKKLTAIAVMVLANQGAPGQAMSVWRKLRHSPELTVAQALATDWSQQLLKRAVCLHRLGSDEAALAALETIESLAKRGLAEPEVEASELLADQRRRARPERTALAYTATPTSDELRNWVEHLDEVGVRPALQLPGFLGREEPLIDGLAKLGAPIAEEIIDATERDNRLTRVEGKGLRFLPVSEVALRVMLTMFNPRLSQDELDAEAKQPRARLLRARWAEWKKMGPAERAITTLDDDGSAGLWAQAASELGQAIDEGDPALKTLRDRPAPTVTMQLIKRISEKDPRCEVAKVLHKWAPEESLDALEQVTGACLPWAAQVLAENGRLGGLDRLALAMKGKTVGLSSLVTACGHPEHADLQRALTAALAAPAKADTVSFAPGNAWGPLLRCAPFNSFLKRALSDSRPLKLGGRTRRTEDAYANELAAGFPTAPAFQIDGSVVVRDSQLKAVRAWVAEQAR